MYIYIYVYIYIYTLWVNLSFNKSKNNPPLHCLQMATIYPSQ